MTAAVDKRVGEVGMEDSEAAGSQDKSGAKHELQNNWTLWFDQPKKKKSGIFSQAEWNESMEKVYSFDTVEDFWCLFNNLLPVSNLESGASYNMFKEGISPQWEDKANEGGGRWYLTLKNRDRDQVDQLWLYMVLGLIGEQIDDQSQICGVVISPRRDEMRISLWTRNAHNAQAQKAIGRNLQKALKLPSHLVANTVYKSHSDDKNRKRTALHRLRDC